MAEHTYEYWQRVSRHIRFGRAAGWFCGIFIPLAMALSALIGWRNQYVDVPTTVEVLIRATIALVAFSAGGFLYWRMIVRPAMKQAEKERGTGADAPR